MRRLILFALLPVLCPFSVAAQNKEEPLADAVKKSIDSGVKYLRRIQRESGSWEVDGDVISNAAVSHPGGKTALAVLAMLNAGQTPKDPPVANALRYLRGIEPNSTYVCALQTLAFVEAGLPEDRQRIQSNVNWLKEARVFRGAEFVGWSYTRAPTGGIADNSNTQYAVLGLWAAKQAGINIPDQIFKDIHDYYKTHQDANGGWNYAVGRNFGALNGVSITMTSAGLCGLLISGMELNFRREKLNVDGTASNCGVYEENPPVQKALHWLGVNFNPELQGRTFYHLYGIERVGRLSGLRYLGNHDWYREGCKFLVEKQNKIDGSWQLAGAWDNWPVVSTSFALLFLSKGRTPVVMSKLVHGAWPRLEQDNDWNNDRNDLRHLTQFVSKELFHVPLAWQIFDISRGLYTQAAGNNPTEEDQQAVTSEMLQSPIMYITGHRSLALRIQAAEKAMLKRYVENGGFILAEACCGSKEFDAGFKDLVAELWPGGAYDKLPADHPVYTAFAPVTPGQPYEIWGLNQGCKTVLVYSPLDLSCRWESGLPNDPNCVQAFRLGANIIAYATGMEPPVPRLTQIPVASNRTESRPRRGFVQIAQLRIPGEAPPAPRAMRNLLQESQKFAGLDVDLTTKELFVGDRSILNYKFLYMHGRKEFHFDPQDLASLRFHLNAGGLLFADACCGKESFDKSFRRFAAELLPNSKLEQVPVNDDLFSAELNGAGLTEETIECRTQAGGPMRRTAPYLEGIKHQGRWVVLYSKYDIGCALERHQSSDCRGYNPASAQKIAQAALLYTLRP